MEIKLGERRADLQSQNAGQGKMGHFPLKVSYPFHTVTSLPCLMSCISSDITSLTLETPLVSSLLINLHGLTLETLTVYDQSPHLLLPNTHFLSQNRQGLRDLSWSLARQINFRKAGLDEQIRWYNKLVESIVETVKSPGGANDCPACSGHGCCQGQAWRF